MSFHLIFITNWQIKNYLIYISMDEQVLRNQVTCMVNNGQGQVQIIVFQIPKFFSLTTTNASTDQ